MDPLPRRSRKRSRGCACPSGWKRLGGSLAVAFFARRPKKSCLTKGRHRARVCTVLAGECLVKIVSIRNIRNFDACLPGALVLPGHETSARRAFPRSLFRGNFGGEFENPTHVSRAFHRTSGGPMLRDAPVSVGGSPRRESQSFAGGLRFGSAPIPNWQGLSRQQRAVAASSVSAAVRRSL